MNEKSKRDMIHFCQKLIRTPSLSGEEEDVANLIKNEMKELDYDEVRTDKAGNVIGKIDGSDEPAPSLTFTAHMDQVDVSSAENWDYDPFGGKVAEGFVHGRGASDTKGAIATQVYLPAILDEVPGSHGDIYVAFAVLEECGGLGSKYLMKSLDTDYAIMGEGTGNEIRIGNRGRVLSRVTFRGTSMHSSSAGPEDVIHYNIAEFLLALRDLTMERGKLGKSSVAPTNYRCDNPGDNVTPSRCEISVDWRRVETETQEAVREKLAKIIPGSGELTIDPLEEVAYTGTRITSPGRQAPFYVSPDDPFVREVVSALEDEYEREVPVSTWDFTTDCGYFVEAGTTIIGFSPCEEKYAHTSRDRVSIELMEESMDGYVRIIEAVSDLE
jgi:putative selenium metabolism hydrolase